MGTQYGDSSIYEQELKISVAEMDAERLNESQYLIQALAWRQQAVTGLSKRMGQMQSDIPFNQISWLVWKRHRERVLIPLIML